MDMEDRFGGTFYDFIIKHMDDDPDRLALSKEKWAGIDTSAAVSTIGGRRRIRSKLPLWYADQRLVYPTRLCIEQCSSQAAAEYKASLVRQIKPGGRVADLTSGLGVDDWAFAGGGCQVLYNDASPLLCEAARHNFHCLGITADFRCGEVAPGKVAEILGGFKPNLIYIDPARREAGTGRKTFKLADCSPDVLALASELRRLGADILLKLSPMADISTVVADLSAAFSGDGGNSLSINGMCKTAPRLFVRELHIVECEGECKELLVWLSRREGGEEKPRLTVAVCGEETATLSAELGTEAFLKPSLYTSGAEALAGACLFEPGKALSKSGLFKTLGQRFGLKEFGISTHLYVSSEIAADLFPFGKIYRITSVLPLSSQNIKELSHKDIAGTLSVRNVPLSAPGLSRRLRLKPSQTRHIFACHIDSLSANFLLFTEPFQTAPTNRAY